MVTGRWAGTAYVAGRRSGDCPHAWGWTHSAGASHCDRCGIRRFTDYGAVRPPGLPGTVTPSRRSRNAADRAAALNVARTVRPGIRWSRAAPRFMAP
ncbi:DUF6255 family natural product biosynthesis protein [Streptomyces sp. NPDC026206]|uniref:DUF6255 family natural product biosynthesis protein n=1 Tax=Streptomyces sp. NPDC026206 TaxID=3157089 RepID=UPI0033DFF727